MLDAEEWQRLKQSFTKAQALSFGDREVYLQSLSKQESAAFLNELHELLIAHDTATRPVAKAPDAIADVAAHLVQDTMASKAIYKRQTLAPDTRLGPWRLGELLGSGGMGDVYAAVRVEGDFEQAVAVKLLSTDAASPDVIQRFLNERQILADLNHPNICALLDGGTSDSGIPYLVMERVNGQPLDAYVQSQQLGLREILQLVQTICDAVDYAHRNLVVHRDLKPTNILVTAEGAVKLLDFGIAKMLSPQVGQGGAQTIAAVRLMTPDYASPEQVRGDPITVASDIYSLGVLLYRLLAGAAPYLIDTPTQAELERVICNTDPVRPSAASDVDATQPHRFASKNHRKSLRGDLDNIVMMALQKDPTKRYPSAAALSVDLKNYLEHKPVSARPHNWRYRAGKFLRRRRLAVIGSAAATVLFVSVVSYYTWQLATQRDRAQLEATKAEEVVQFMVSLFQSSAPAQSLGELITARSVLDQGAARASELYAQPEVQAALQDAMGNAFLGLGLYEDSAPLLQAAHKTRYSLLGKEHPATLRSLKNLAKQQLVTGNYQAAEQDYATAWRLSQQTLDKDDPATLDALQQLAVTQREQGEYAAAETGLKTVVAALESQSPEGSLALASALSNLGNLLEKMGRPREAIPLLQRALGFAEQCGSKNHPAYQAALDELGWVYLAIGNFDEATQVFTEYRERSIALYGADHLFSIVGLGALAATATERGDYAGAETLQRQEVRQLEQAVGKVHPIVAIAHNDLGATLSRLGRPDEAIAHYRHALSLNEKIHGLSHPETATSLSNLGVLLRNTGRYTEALERVLQAWRIRQQLLGDNHQNTLTSRFIYAATLRLTGELMASKREHQQVLMNRERLLGKDHPHYALTLASYAQVLLDLKELDAAAAIAQEADVRLRRAYSDDHPRVTANSNVQAKILATLE